MTIFSVFIGLLLNTSPLVQAAVDCYDQLDYQCTAEKILEALATDLTDKERVRAHLYQALVAVAWREQARTEQAVKALLKVDPTFRPTGVPKALSQLYDKFRPQPQPPWTPTADVRFKWSPLLGEDAKTWSDGLGIELSAGLTRTLSYGFNFAVGYDSHIAQNTVSGFETLQRYNASVEANQWFQINWLEWGPVLRGGISYNRIKASSRYQNIRPLPQLDPFYGAHIGTGLGAKVSLPWHLAISVQTTGETVVRNFEDRIRLSFLLPVYLAIRYE